MEDLHKMSSLISEKSKFFLDTQKKVKHAVAQFVSSIDPQTLEWLEVANIPPPPQNKS